jgi:hypothetical protein
MHGDGCGASLDEAKAATDGLFWPVMMQSHLAREPYLCWQSFADGANDAFCSRSVSEQSAARPACLSTVLWTTHVDVDANDPVPQWVGWIKLECADRLQCRGHLSRAKLYHELVMLSLARAQDDTTTNTPVNCSEA